MFLSFRVLYFVCISFFFFKNVILSFGFLFLGNYVHNLQFSWVSVLLYSLATYIFWIWISGLDVPVFSYFLFDYDISHLVCAMLACNFILFINVWWPVWITRWWLKFMDQILRLTGFFLCYVCMFSLCLYGLSLDTLASFDSTKISVSKLAITVKVRVNNCLPLCVSRVTD